MSDTVTINPYDLGTPEYDQFNQGLNSGIKAVPNALTRFPVGLVSSLLSSPDATGAERFIPSAATGLYSFANDAQHLIGRLLQPVTGAPPVDLPGAAEAGKLTQGAADFATTLVPHVAPSNPMEATLGDMAQSAGQMGPFIGESPLSAMSPALKAMTEFALPGLASKAAPVVGAALTGGVDAVTGSASASTTGQPQTVTVPLEDQQPTDQSQPMQQPGQLPLPPPLPPELTRVSNPATTAPAPQTVSLPMEVHIPFDSMNHPETAWTWKDVALYGGGALAVLVGGPRILKMVEDLSGNTRAARYADASVPFNAQQAATQAATIPIDDTRIPAPLPGVAGDGLTSTAEAVQDRNARLNAYTNATAATPNEAQQLRAQTGLINNDQAFDARLQNIAVTGEDPVSGLRMPSPVDHWTKVAALSDSQQIAYNQARYAANELDNRVMNFNNLSQPLLPVNLSTYDDASLRDYVTQARADPVVNDLLTEANLISTAKMHIAEARGMLSSGDVTKILRDHPNYMSDADMSGLIENPFSARTLDPSSGFDSALHPSWELDKQHLETFYRAIEQNDLRSNIVQQAYAFQNDPSVAQIFRPSQDSSGAWVAGKDTIPVRVDGELQYHHVASPALRAAIEQSPSASGALIGGLNMLRNASQSTITGTAAMIAGHFFAPLNAIRSAGEGAIIRPTGTAGGYLDKALQMASGGRVGLPGDPTAMLTMPYEWLAGAGAEGAKALASVLDPAATNFANVKMRSVLGNSVVDAIHTRVQAAWDNSIRAQMEKTGAMNSAGMSSTPVPSQQMGAAEQVFSPINNLVPQLFRINGPLGSAMPTFVRLNNLANTVKSIVGEAAHEQFYRLNSQVSPEVRSFETRNLTGDPGTHGASSLIRGYGAVSDYANIAIQDFTRVARAFKEQPATTALGLIVGLGVPAMAEIFSAMLHGPDAMQHMQDEVSNQDGASNVHIYIPGQAPEAAMKIPLAINMRVFYPFVKQALMDVMSLQSHSANEPLSQWAMDGMRDFFSHHITQSTVDQSVAGFSTAASPPLPTLAEPMANAVGKTLTPTIDNVYQMIDQFPNIPGMISHDLAGTPRAPGQQAGGDTLTGTVGGNVFKHMITSTFGYMGTAITSALDTFESAQRSTNDPSYAIGNVIQDYKDRVQDSLPFLNGVVWNHDDRLAVQTPLVQRVEQSLDAMRPYQNWKSDFHWDGLTRAHGVVLPGATPMPTDPMKQQLYATSGAYMAVIEKKMMPQIQDIRKQMSALGSSPLPPEQVKEIRNSYVRDMQQKYEGVAGVINDANDQLSKIAGKQITVTQLPGLLNKH